MTVKNIIKEYLQANYYCGLIDNFEECSCTIEDLMPCSSEEIMDCAPVTQSYLDDLKSIDIYET